MATMMVERPSSINTMSAAAHAASQLGIGGGAGRPKTAAAGGGSSSSTMIEMQEEVLRCKGEVEFYREDAERERDALVAQLKGQALSAEEEQARQNALRLEEEREKRVAHLQGVAARRIQQLGLARGWSAWAEAYEQRLMHQRMLRQAASRLLRPKLAAAAAHWRRSWEEEQEAKAEAERQLLLAAQQRQRAALEARKV